MTMKRWDGGVYVDLTVAKRWDGSAWVDLTIAKRWDGVTWVDITLPGGGGGGSTLSLTGDTSSGGVAFGSDPVLTMTSEPVNVTTTGGTGPYVYNWSRIGGDSAIQALAPTAHNTQFTVNANLNRTYNATFRITVTDSLLNTAFHDVFVSFTYEAQFA
jgi:hypothetical protein